MKRITTTLLLVFFDATPEELDEHDKQELITWLGLFSGTCFVAVLTVLFAGLSL